MSSWKIVPSEIQDLDFACHLYMDAIAFQKSKGFPEYRSDDREVQAEYIKAGCHFKLMQNEVIAGMFNIQLSDKKIWHERDQNDGIYLHGVLIESKYKGQRLFEKILDWSVQYAKEKGRSYVRLDTWANNPSLTDYYEKFGFEMIKEYQIPEDGDTPINCRGNKVVLMEYDIK